VSQRAHGAGYAPKHYSDRNVEDAFEDVEDAFEGVEDVEDAFAALFFSV
jgi:predicted ribonuclease toxin of YeeF-YezG toxin-antitoxin module